MEECALLDKVRAKEGKTYADRRYEQLTEEALAFVLCTLRLMFLSSSASFCSCSCFCSSKRCM